MQQIYRRTPIPKCDFNKATFQVYWNRTSAWVYPVNLLHIFRTPFTKKTSEWLLLGTSSFNEFLEKRLSNSLSKYSETACKTHKVMHHKAPKVMGKLFSQLSLCIDVKYRCHNVIRTVLMVPRNYHISYQKFGFWFPPKSKILKQLQLFAKRLENGPGRCPCRP